MEKDQTLAKKPAEPAKVYPPPRADRFTGKMSDMTILTPAKPDPKD